MVLRFSNRVKLFKHACLILKIHFPIQAIHVVLGEIFPLPTVQHRYSHVLSQYLYNIHRTANLSVFLGGQLVVFFA